MSQALQSLLDLLDLEQIEQDIFRGQSRAAVSLDHAMWFHRPFRADEWLLYDQESPSASGGRGLGQARIYTQDGRLAVSVIQEGVVRVPR